MSSPAPGASSLTGWAVAAGIVAYLAFAWWFFAVGAVLAGGNWGIAGTYLADWVSYEDRPQIDFKQDRPRDRLSALLRIPAPTGTPTG